MFGNRIVYTSSPGGQRRGLIWQGGKIDKGHYTRGTYIYLNLWYESYGLSDRGLIIQLEDNGNLTLRFRNTMSRVTYRTNMYILDDRWYPLQIIPVYNFVLGNNDIDLSHIEDYIDNPYDDFMIKVETIKFYLVDGSYNTFDCVVVYQDITNVPIYTSNSNAYYDITGIPERIIALKGFNQKIDVFTETPLKIYGKTKYMYSPRDNTVIWDFGNFQMEVLTKFDEMHEGFCEFSGKIFFNESSNHRYLYPSVVWDDFIFRGDYPFKIQGLGNSGNCFFFGPQITNNGFWIHTYDIVNNTDSVYWNALLPYLRTDRTQPSNWIVGSGYNFYRWNVLIKYEGDLFTWDENNYGSDVQFTTLTGTSFESWDGFDENSFYEIAETT